MRRIQINDEVRQVAKDYVNNLFKNKDEKNFNFPLKGLKKLSDKLKAANQDEYAKYVDNIVSNYDGILLLEPKQFEGYKEKYFKNLDDNQLKAKLKGCLPKKRFFELVVDAMKYNEVQKSQIRPFMKKLGIKACVYCNASYTVSTNDNKATFHIDHLYPKSKYPFLCISFFNLQPACIHCNEIKADRTEYKFELYTLEKSELDPFYFSIDDKSIIRYMLTNNSDELKFKLKSTDNGIAADEHSDFFHIDGLYAQFTDAAEEVVWKSKIYNSAYREQMLAAFKCNFSYNMADFKRFYLGFYPDKKDVNKRPLTLLMQGIAKDMGLE